jgi:hypothetical protein
MRRLLLGGFVVAVAFLTAACGGDSEEAATSSTVSPGSSPSAATLSADEVIKTTQELPVLYKVDHPDGTYELQQSTMSDRMDVLCRDEPVWSAQEREKEWRVVAECKKEESGTAPAFGFELLHFEWIYYTDLRRVMPVSQAAHDAQYPYPQPSPFPIGTPFSIPPPTVTP